MVDRKEIKWTIYYLLWGWARAGRGDRCRPVEQDALPLLFRACGGFKCNFSLGFKYWEFSLEVAFLSCGRKKKFISQKRTKWLKTQSVWLHRLSFVLSLIAIYNKKLIYGNMKTHWFMFNMSCNKSCDVKRFSVDCGASVSSISLSYQALCGIISCVWCGAVG